MLFTAEDAQWLRKSGEILHGQIEQILDVWYGFIASKPYLLEAFTDPATGKPDEAYLAAVRKRFACWISDTGSANYDQALGSIINTRSGGATTAWARTARTGRMPRMSCPCATCSPCSIQLPPLSNRSWHETGAAAEVQRMREAWTKSVLLQLILWCEPYVDPEDF